MPVEGERHAGFPRMPRDGQQQHLVGGAGADAGPSCTLVVPLDHASDGAVRRLAFEPDAPPNPFEGVRIGVLPGPHRCEGPELAAAEVGVSDVGDGNSGTPAASRENLRVWLNDAQDDGAWRDATVQQMREGEHSYSPEETALIVRGTALLGTFATGKGKARPMRRLRRSSLRRRSTTRRAVCLSAMWRRRFTRRRSRLSRI
jgi:hypothetical protein